MLWSALRVFVWIGVGYELLTTKVDPDLWGHVRFGLDILRSHQLTSTDPYSFTSDLSWINHEWLSELTFGGAYAVMGTDGLIIVRLLATIATFLTIALAARRAPQNWSGIAGCLVVLAIAPIVTTVRPQLWTLLFLAVLCRILTAAPRWRYWLPLVFVLWVNMHGGWIVGFGVLTVWSLIEAFTPSAERPANWLVLGIPVACTVATLCNPYGWHLWEFLARTVRLSRPDIVEWQPIWYKPNVTVPLWIAAVSWVALALRYAERRLPQAVGVVAMLAFASMRVIRLLPLFMVASVILLMGQIRKAPTTERQRLPEGRTIVDMVFATVGVLFVASPLSVGCIQMEGPWLPDVAAASSISAAHARGRLVSWFNWGEYAIWHFGPALKVSADGRRETVYTDAVLSQQRAIADGDPKALAALEQTLPEYAWLPKGHGDGARAWFRGHGYRIDVDTPLSFVAVRHDLPKVPEVAIGSAGCFPAP